MMIAEEELIEAIQEERFLKPPWSNLYIVNEKTIAKKFTIIKNAINEYDNLALCYIHRINVPEPKGFISLEAREHYVLIQRVEGESRDSLGRELHQRAIQLFEKELDKILALRICPTDIVNSYNSLYSTEEDKLWVFDTEYWELEYRGNLDEKKKEIMNFVKRSNKYA